MNDAICMVAVIVTVVLGWWRVDGVLYQSPADVCRVNACNEQKEECSNDI